MSAQVISKTDFLVPTFVPLLIHGVLLLVLLGVFVYLRITLAGLYSFLLEKPNLKPVFTCQNSAIFPTPLDAKRNTDKLKVWYNTDIPMRRAQIENFVAKLTGDALPLIRLGIFWLLPIQPLISIITLAADNAKTEYFGGEMAMAVISFVIALVNAVLVVIVNDVKRKKTVGRWNLKAAKTNLYWSYESSPFSLYKLKASEDVAVVDLNVAVDKLDA